jgi:MSHA biogenesis protein MshQ
MRAAWCALVLALACGAARADTPIALFKSFAGNVNFVGTQKTMRTKANSVDPCAVAPASTDLRATLAGIPAGATILSAQLYWAASNSTAGSKVMFEGADVVAPAARQYFSATIGSGFDYVGGATDVTAQVSAKRNGDYTFSGLAVKNGAPYCAVEGVLGGFALLVMFADPAEQFRVLNLYEGFQFIRYSGVTLTLGNFRTPNPLDSATARISHITWEGDQSLGANGEDLLFNGVEMSDGLNPVQNQFNSASNINNDAASYGIDFDAYTVGAGVIGAGQTSATTRYQSGQDLVLLNAEIIAMPNVPTADLAINMTRNSALVPGRNASYTLSVSNAGPNIETGPVVVVDTLPVGLGYLSAAGSGWSCTIATRTLTCSRSGSVAVGETLPPIALSVLVSGSGTLTNTASVSGKLFDNVSANSSAADSAATEPAPPYAFTDSACVHGQPFGAAQQSCKDMTGAPLLAGATLPLYVTTLTDGVPARLSTNRNTTVTFAFALGCLMPASNAGIRASVGGAQLPLCTPNGGTPASWSAQLGMAFPVGSPSAAAGAGLVYADVGKIQLFLRDTAGQVVGSVPFVSKPATLGITAVLRSADNFANPQAASGAGYGFARVGEAFTIRAAALTVGGAIAPNFGSEGARLSLDWQRGGDAAAKAAMLNLPALAGDFTAIVGGVFTGTAFSVDEAGILAVTPRLASNDYLGAGAPPAAAATAIGRFYPDHFDTSTAATLQCLAHMKCPADVSGAVYAGQPFAVTARPMNAQGGVLRNYNGVLARPVTLSAYSQPGGASANPSGGALSNNVIAVASMAPGAPITGLPVYALPPRFSNSAPRARDWVGPTAVYLRAEADEAVAGGAPVKVSSLRASGSIEGGNTIVSGRLALDSPQGSELVKMPVRAQAQYWAVGSRWEASATDNISTVQSGGIAFANCRKALGPPCKSALLGVTADTLLTLKNGVAIFWLKPPGAGNTGSAEFQMNNPAWLPSTIGRAVFGGYASALIYLREVY